MAQDSEARLATIESAGSVLWFLMDGFWLLELEWPTYLLLVPTVAAHLISFAFTRRTAADLTVTASLNSWVLMNALWVIGDLQGLPALVVAAKVFFGLGVAMLAVAALSSRTGGQVLKRVVHRFRRVRLGPS